jgi:hypothetical protein
MFKGEVTVLQKAQLCSVMKLHIDTWFIFGYVDSTDTQGPDDVRGVN